jgi:hypothetical protein
VWLKGGKRCSSVARPCGVPASANGDRARAKRRHTGHGSCSPRRAFADEFASSVDFTSVLATRSVYTYRKADIRRF